MPKSNPAQTHFKIKKSFLLTLFLSVLFCPFLIAEEERAPLPAAGEANTPTPVRQPEAIADQASASQPAREVEKTPYKPPVSSRVYEKKGLESFYRDGALRRGDGLNELEPPVPIVESGRHSRSREGERNSNGRRDESGSSEENKRSANPNLRDELSHDFAQLKRKKPKQAAQADSDLKEKKEAPNENSGKTQAQAETVDLSKLLIPDPQKEAAVKKDLDKDGVPDEKDDDLDGDGIPNELDDIADLVQVDPSLPAQVQTRRQEAQSDRDGDGIPDQADTDIDGDGIPNDKDLDADGDGVPDLNKAISDKGGNGTPDALDSGIDGDGILNLQDEAAAGGGNKDQR